MEGEQALAGPKVTMVLRGGSGAGDEGGGGGAGGAGLGALPRPPRTSPGAAGRRRAGKARRLGQLSVEAREEEGARRKEELANDREAWRARTAMTVTMQGMEMEPAASGVVPPATRGRGEQEPSIVVVAASAEALCDALGAFAHDKERSEIEVHLAPGQLYDVQVEHGLGNAFPVVEGGKRVRVVGHGAQITRGSGAGSCAPAFRFWMVFGTLELVDLTLRCGRSKGSFGGAVAVGPGGELSATDCVLEKCESRGLDGETGGAKGGGGGGGGQGACGGAIFALGGRVCLERCKLTHNEVSGGNGGHAAPHHGRYVGNGGRGGGRGGGAGGLSGHDGEQGVVFPGQLGRQGECADSLEARARFCEGAYGGGGGGSAGSKGSSGGVANWGGGGGGAGAKTLGGFDETGRGGEAGFGGGNGIFAWELAQVHIAGLHSKNITRNRAMVNPNVFESGRVQRVQVATTVEAQMRHGEADR
ncbi:unnamed protein product [Durusdinium trenchii]|uniref:Right handed beta helix domain-containing protein n=1 Tax=Durusdinium trenchii TaxID=1381693 RepID=A0ABP0LAX8_9DINO